MHFLLGLATAIATVQSDKAPAPLPVLIDTDIGSDVDDAFALALALASPELAVQGITTCAAQAEDRAWIVCRFLIHGGFKPIPVAFGRGKQPDYPIDWQIQYRRHPAPIFNRTQKPEKSAAVDFLHEKLKAQPGKLTIIALGPLTNLGQLLEQHPDAAKLIQRIVLMGGAIDVGYKGVGPAEPEWNIKSDVAAARTVFASGVPLTVVPLDATAKLALTTPRRARLFDAYTLLTLQVQTLYELWDDQPLTGKTPILFDPAAVAVAAGDVPGMHWQERRLRIDDKGMTICLPREGKPNARVLFELDREKFLDWYVDRVRSFGPQALPEPAKNLTKLVERGAFPAKVHVAEDYDTDIEKRWWMTGKAETKDVPPGGRRAQRGVLTQDFDDRQGNMKTSYRAVIFNPVPGPPMGPNTRLSFRYKLIGTDKMRVQLYSLTKGYHRYLSLQGLPQGVWREGAVDMTHMLRPDGSGGALAADERIDDIQFYVDPRAEVLIDDVVLYEAAVPGEKRPFPERILFTGWFDTGKQGKEWPGDFEIVNHDKPLTWKCAKAAKAGWIKLNLRGERRVAETMEVSFRYRLADTNILSVALVNNSKNNSSRFRRQQDLFDLAKGNWSETTVRFTLPEAAGKDAYVDEIHFDLPGGAGSGLWIDDVLLYKPARSKGN